MTAVPLAGQHVLVTRPPGQAAPLRARLETAGATVTTAPTIRLVGPSDPGTFQRRAAHLPEYDWVAVTSVNAVERLAVAARNAGCADALSRCRLAAVGPSTSDAARVAWGVECLVPRVYRGEALADSIVAEIPPPLRAGTRVLLVQAEGARPVLRDRLLAAGAQVDVAPAYAVDVNWTVRDLLLEFIELGRGDWLTFTASSAARAFVQLVGPQTGGALVAAISPVTGATLADLGLPVHLVAETHTMAGLVDALVGAAERPGRAAEVQRHA
ncbi:uroporphyrinogen-III synthase [Candidatus Palauibacter sp.]|uniref:uroporphyrinogen-III synthase n=1 Tax=Candidatus Palauibacter sp. TaxID=3101350 RepID=UPI003AF24D2B